MRKAENLAMLGFSAFLSVLWETIWRRGRETSFSAIRAVFTPEETAPNALNYLPLSLYSIPLSVKNKKIDRAKIVKMCTHIVTAI